MNTKDLLNNKYKILCELLGDLEYRKFIMEQDILKIRNEISTLNSIAPDLNKLGAAFEIGIRAKYEKTKESSENSEKEDKV